MEGDLQHMFSGDTIGKYRLVSRLGRGGMGEVWLAKASGYGGFTKTVVLKTLLPELASDPLFVELLAREAKICATLSHPNLIEVFDFTEHGGIYLLAMEHVLGQPLNYIMKAAYERGWSIPAWFALRIAWDACCGLQCAHDQGIIHCDLSPSNIMVTFTGTTKVLDFGVAHAAAHGPKSDRLKGKFSYMAPERITSRTTDRRTDVYALGVMLYLLFAGQLPFTADTDAELLRTIVTQRPRPPSELCAIDPRIEQVILRAMQPDPAARHQTISEVMAALAPCLDGQLGTYGQQHVAAFVNSLFGSPATHGPLKLPPVPQLGRADVRATGPSQTLRTEPLLDADVELEIDGDSVVHDIETGRRSPVPPAPAARSLALGSSSMPPLAKPARPLIAVFSKAPAPAEPKTSVQSLFEERPSIVGAAASVFARGTRDSVEPAAVTDPAALADQRWAPAGPAPDAPPRPDVLARERTQSVFGGTSAPRPTDAPSWPWPTSRTKSE